MAISLLLSHPEEEVVAFVPTIDDLVNDHLQSNELTKDNGEGVEDDDSVEPAKVTPSEALKMLDGLESFWLQQEDQSLEFITALRNMKDKVNLIKTHQLKQMIISDFFQCI